MDKNVLKAFIEQAKPRLLKKYAVLLTEMLTDKQMESLKGFFEVSLTMKEGKAKAPEEPEIEPESKPAPVSRPRPQSRPDFMDEPEPEPEKEEPEPQPENVFNESTLTKEDLDKMEKGFE